MSMLLMDATGERVAFVECKWGRNVDVVRLIRRLREKARTVARFAAASHQYRVSRPGESHPRALAELYVNVSAHTAPIIQPPASTPADASGRTAGARDEQGHRASDWLDGDVAVASCIWVRLFFVGGPTSLCGGGEAGGSWTRQRVVVVRKRRRGQAGDPTVLVPSATAGGFRWYSRASWKVSVRIKAPAARGGLRTASRGRHADRPFDEPATSAARRIAAATWMMSSTTVASRAYAAVPARRSRCSRGASRTSSAPAAGSARRRADAGRGGARSPDAQPASCRRSFPCDFRARTAPSTRHRWRPRPDRQSLPGCVGRDVLAGACVPTAGPAGAVPVRVRSRSSAGLRWRRGRLWHPRRQHRPPRPGDRCGGRRFAALARRLYVLGILSPQPSQVPLPKAPYQNAARMSRRERT